MTPSALSDSQTNFSVSIHRERFYKMGEVLCMLSYSSSFMLACESTDHFILLSHTFPPIFVFSELSWILPNRLWRNLTAITETLQLCKLCSLSICKIAHVYFIQRLCL